MMRWIALFFAVVFSFALSTSAYAKRVALVIGNNAYTNVSALEKAVNDAESMGRTLQQIGYDVILQKDVDRRKFNQNLQLFLSRLGPGDEALVFYAGHGVKFRGRFTCCQPTSPMRRRARNLS